MAKSAAERAADKLKRKARDEHRFKIAAAASEIEEALHEMMEDKAKQLEVDVAEIRARFLIYANARCNNSKLTVWNGLVHIKSKEWADKKDEYPGSAFIGYVVERIHEENRVEQLPRNQSSSQKIQLDFLYATTAVECMLFIVKGRPQDGLVGTYHSTPKAQNFIETHLALPITHFVELMEGSVLGGAVGTLNSHRTPTQVAKTECRQSLLKSLRVAATSVGADGSAPVTTDPLEIPMVEYKHYSNIIRQYKVVVKGWPIDSQGSLVDPSTMGLAKLRAFTRLINDPESNYGFQRITNGEWEEWCKKSDEDIAKGTNTISSRKTRSDAGKKRKKNTSNTVNALEMVQEMAKAKKKRVDKPKKSSSQKRIKKATEIPSNQSSLAPASPKNNLSDLDDSQPPVQQPEPRPDETRAVTSQPFTFTPPEGAPAWPAQTPRTPSTPKPRCAPLPNPPARQEDLAGPSTPQRSFRFVHNTPESIRARSSTPQARRSQSPAIRVTTSGQPTSRMGVFQGTDIPLVLDPALNSNDA